MADFKFNLPTVSSLYTEGKKDYDDSFLKKARDVGIGQVTTGAFTKHNQGIRTQYFDNQTKLKKALRENKEALRKSNLSPEQKKAKSEELLKKVRQIDANLRAKYDKDFIKPSKSKTKKASGGKTVNKRIGGSIATKKKKVAAKKKQSGHNRLY